MNHDLDATDPPPGLTKDEFMRSVIREMAGILEETVGENEASVYVNRVGLHLGRILNKEYRATFDTNQMSAHQVVSSLVHLKKRIGGEFSIEAQDEGSIALVNSACPFGEKVIGRPSLCRMTANVFGHIAAENLQYARVAIEEAIARGDRKCRVLISLRRPQGTAGTNETEFFGSSG